MKFLFLPIAFLFTVCCYGQEKCGTDEQYAWLMQHDPEYARLIQNKPIESQNPARVSNIPDTIPVVVHVIFVKNSLGTFGDVSDAAINNAINNLNKNFNDPTPGRVNIGIYFKLAQTDPDCYPTTGIVRVDASDDPEYASRGMHYGNGLGGINQVQLAEKSYWDNTKYLNIWIVFGFSDNSIGGYAFYPTGTKTPYDGIVLKNIGALTHEMGHAFNLRHTFEGSNGSTCAVNNDCTTDGDGICDTPPVLQSTSCDPLAINPCTNQPNGKYVINFMSYSCSGQFSPLQRERMLNAMSTSRASLLTYNTEWPPPHAPIISIAMDDNDNIIDNNQLVTFTPTVTGNLTIRYRWLKNGYEVSTNRIYKSNSLVHGDEIACIIEDPSLPCHTIVRSYSNKIKISTDHKHFVSIYPNPVVDKISAWTPSDDMKINMIRLFTIDGKLLETKKVPPSSLVQYSLNNVPAGLYVLEFTSDKGKDIIKVVKGKFKIY